jgi:hypothetical protein
MIYQHGLGYSKYGFNDALPYEDYIGVMQTASDIFMANDMSNDTLNTVYNRLVDTVGIFPNYVISPFVYKSGSVDQPAEELSVPADNERILDLLSRAEQEEEQTETPEEPETPEMKRDAPIQPEVSDQIQPEGLPGIPRTSSSCK